MRKFAVASIFLSHLEEGTMKVQKKMGTIVLVSEWVMTVLQLAEERVDHKILASEQPLGSPVR
jgi:hypothetical protein